MAETWEPPASMVPIWYIPSSSSSSQFTIKCLVHYWFLCPLAVLGRPPSLPPNKEDVSKRNCKEKGAFGLLSKQRKNWHAGQGSLIQKSASYLPLRLLHGRENNWLSWFKSADSPNRLPTEMSQFWNGSWAMGMEIIRMLTWACV